MAKKKKTVSKKSSRPKEGHITAYDVARLAGVSQSAVSRSFTPGASIAEATRLKVNKAAKKLAYRPNLIARSLSTRRSGMIGVVVSTLEYQFMVSVLKALSTAFTNSGLRMLLFFSPQGTPASATLEEVLHSRVDGLVMVGNSVSTDFVEECQRVGLPVVILFRKTTNPSISSVSTADREGSELIADLLIAGGHERIAYIAGQEFIKGLEWSLINRDREEAFRNRLSQRGVQLCAREVGNFSFQHSLEIARKLLNQKNRPDAVFCANDQMAFAFINVARAEMGLKVGEDISIVGFDNSDLSQWPIFNLTTYDQPLTLMAEKIVQSIEGQLSDSEKVSNVVVPGRLIIRGSTRMPVPIL